MSAPWPISTVRALQQNGSDRGNSGRATGITKAALTQSGCDSGPRLAGVALITRLMQRGALVHPPVVAFPFAHIAAAHTALESGAVTGKIVIEGPGAY